MHSLREVLARDGSALQNALSLTAEEARSEVQSLLQYALGVNRAFLLAHPEHVLDAGQKAAYAKLLQRRLGGEPIAYIFGEREFFGLNFKITPATLIPRPETELLVELALAHIPLQGRVLDLGTGSGAIALAIARARPDAQVTALDISVAALEVARQNAQGLGSANISFLRSDWFAALTDVRFDLIVSNPPYVAAGDEHLVQGDLRFEPRTALVSGLDGMDDIRHIIAGATAYLGPGGWLLLEHGYNQAAASRSLLLSSGFDGVFSAMDMAGIERVSGGRVTVQV
ncbi:MAG: peptide chain release factor N(5)-glutamine methyltransferase [Sideroxydans sp.]|jgi:release factor glutamine methyltransferase